MDYGALGILVPHLGFPRSHIDSGISLRVCGCRYNEMDMKTAIVMR